MRHYIVCLSAILFAVLIGYNPAAAVDNVPDNPQTASISFGAEFASSGQGMGGMIRSIYMPLIFTWFPTERIDAGIELPIISQRGTNSSMHLYETQQNAASNMFAQQGGGGGSISTNIGDIILRFGMIAKFETENLPQLRPSMYVKCPTADKSDGTGTGEFDFGGGLEAMKWYGNLLLTADAYYNYQGKATGLGLTDYYSYSAGIGWQATNTLRPMLIVKGATAPTSTSGDLLETRLRLLWAITPATSLDTYGSRGIADSSPDYGGGVAIIHAF